MHRAMARSWMDRRPGRCLGGEDGTQQVGTYTDTRTREGQLEGSAALHIGPVAAPGHRTRCLEAGTRCAGAGRAGSSSSVTSHGKERRLRAIR